MEEINYKGEKGIFLTHKEKNNLFHLINRQSELCKEALHKSQKIMQECRK